MKLEIMGTVNKKGSFEVDSKKSVKDILIQYANGIINNKRIKLVQIGGPLGTCIRGKEINNSIEYYKEDMFSNSILFLDELMCPIDYMRFLSRFMIRELRVDNEFTRKLHTLIEEIAEKNTRNNIIEELNNTLDGRIPINIAEEKVIHLYRYFLEKFKEEIEEHVYDDRCRNGICRGLYITQCINACPAEVDVPGYVELMKRKDFNKAYTLMKQSNPLSFICGKICARPCESRCRRGEIENHVGVRALKRFAAEVTLDSKTFEEKKLKPKNKKVAIIGAGPAGLSGAYYLAKTGYEVVVYEAEKKVGGMLAMGIPEYRLPQKSIDMEVESIKKLGVSILTGVKVGRDIKLSELKKKYDAVLLSTGCPVGNIVPGVSGRGVETAVDFLKEVKLENRNYIGKRTFIIGGGDVAMDAARTAKRLGAEKAVIISLEGYDDMPASLDEKEGAKEEGIEFLSAYGTDKVIISDNKFTGINIKKCISIMDEEYNFSPVYDEEVQELQGDSLIYAIGQRPDLSYIDCFDISGQRFLSTENYQTSVEGIFAAGDISKTDIAITAIANAKKAAVEIDKFLGGTGIYDGDIIEVPESILDCTTWDDKLVEESALPVQKRVKNFSEVIKTCNLDEALFESNRCMRCDRNSRRKLHLK